MSESAKVTKKNMKVLVNQDLLELRHLSFAARLTLAWALGKQDGWTFHISHMWKALGITDKTWPRIKKELIEHGFFVQTRIKEASGKFVWINQFSDAPLYSISTPPKRSDGSGSDAFAGDIDTKTKVNDLFATSRRAGRAHSAATKKIGDAVESLHCILICNGLDRMRVETLTERFGVEEVESAAKKTLPAPGYKHPYQSDVYKLLKQMHPTLQRTKFEGSDHAKNHGNLEQPEPDYFGNARFSEPSIKIINPK